MIANSTLTVSCVSAGLHCLLVSHLRATDYVRYMFCKVRSYIGDTQFRNIQKMINVEIVACFMCDSCESTLVLAIGSFWTFCQIVEHLSSLFPASSKSLQNADATQDSGDEIQSIWETNSNLPLFQPGGEAACKADNSGSVIFLIKSGSHSQDLNFKYEDVINTMSV